MGSTTLRSSAYKRLMNTSRYHVSDRDRQIPRHATLDIEAPLQDVVPPRPRLDVRLRQRGRTEQLTGVGKLPGGKLVAPLIT